MKKEQVSATDAQNKNDLAAVNGGPGASIAGSATDQSDAPVDPVIVDFSDEEKALIGAIVVDKLKEILPPIVEAQVLDLLAGDKVTLSGPSLDDVLAGITPDLIATALAQQAEDKAAQDRAAADEAALSMREQAARATARADKAAAKAIEQRGRVMADAGERFAAMFGPEGTAKGFPLSDLTIADDRGETRVLPKLLLDNGKAFCVDFVKSIDAEHLLEADGMIRLTAKIDLPADMPGFAVTGVVLAIDDYHAMRCEIPTPLHVGDGRGAHLAADSLVFRAPAPIAA